MQAVFEASLAFPTVIFTVMLGFVLLYAALVIVGALDLDFLDGVLGLDAFDGLDSLDGAMDSVDGAMDAADGAMDAADGAGDGIDEVGDAGVIAGIMAALGIAGIPITVWGSVLVLLSWVLCMISMDLVAPMLPSGAAGYAIAGVIGFLSFLVGGFVASRLVRPLRKVYVTEKAPRRSSLVGRSCTVLSAHVDMTSGRGEIDDGGAGFIAEIRCDRPNSLTRGSIAVVYDYDPAEGIFHVAPSSSDLADVERELSS